MVNRFLIHTSQEGYLFMISLAQAKFTIIGNREMLILNPLF